MKPQYRENPPMAISILVVLCVCVGAGCFVSWICPECVKNGGWDRRPKKSKPVEDGAPDRLPQYEDGWQ